MAEKKVKKKNQAAVELAKRRALALTPARRREIASMGGKACAQKRLEKTTG